MNDYDASKTEVEIGQGNVFVQYNLNPYGAVSLEQSFTGNTVDCQNPSSSFPLLNVYPNVDIEAAKVEVATRAVSKMGKPKVDLLVDISQWRQLVDMFAMQVYRARWLKQEYGTRTLGDKVGYKLLRHYQSKAVNVPDAWVEARFGWRPLLASLQGLMQALAAYQFETTPVKRKFARAEEFINFGSSKTNIVESSISGWVNTTDKVTSSYTASSELSIGIFGLVVYKPKVATLNNSFGLDLSDIPFAVWDLIPLSFIVDTFINVGDWLRSVMAYFKHNGVEGSCLTVKTSLKKTFTWQYNSAFYQSGSGSGYKSYRRTAGDPAVTTITTSEIVRRNELPSIYLPTVRWDAASWDDIYNTLDEIALVIQRLR